MEISVEGSVIVDQQVPVSVFPDPNEGVWTTQPNERAHIEIDSGGKPILIAKRMGEVEVMFIYPLHDKNVISARKVLTVLDIYHQGASGCSAGIVSILAIPFTFFIYLALKRKKK
jgi:hypothetical protein